MAKTAQLDIKAQNISEALRDFFRSMLQLEEISEIMVQQRLSLMDGRKYLVMPSLVSDPERLDGVDPLAPVFPMNAARIVSRLTRKQSGGKVAVVLRPCEIRAFVELVKLKQGHTDDIFIIGFDCPGAYKNTDYFRLLEQHGKGLSQEFCQNVFSGKGSVIGDKDIAAACKACEHPIPEGADIGIGLFGVDITSHLLIQALTPKGEELFAKLKLSESDEPQKRQSAIAETVAARTAYRDKMFAETDEAVNGVEKLTAYLANCVNCYNCRVACPVCYCKECVFVTDVFNHEPAQYLQWARRKGLIKMPTDTLFYHLTRLAHMSTACVGCGQCSNACPNDIPVMELFRTVAYRTQKAFDYEAGRSTEEAPPLSEFREHEFGEVVGIN